MTSYGVPYQGSKSKIAVDIIKLLPKGKRLVDLFGGGGAITHAALLSDKWEEVLYNDINPLITQLFLDAYNGKYRNYKRIVRRAEFHKLKDTDPFVRYIYSFGNCGRTYLFSEEIEPVKCKFIELILSEGSTEEKRLMYEEIIYLLEKFINNGGKIEQLHQLHLFQRLNRLNSIADIKNRSTLFNHEVKLEVSNISYEDYEYKDGDVVYCDIPYENTEFCYSNNKRNTFDSLKFYDWVKTRDYPVYFSSYDISDNSFEKILVKTISRPFKSIDDTEEKTEYLYTYKRG